MKQLITLEELAQLVLGLFLFSQLDFAWWWFPALILVPDISMLGYLLNSQVGAWLYNFFHHKALGVAVMVLGYYFNNEQITLAGIILFSHSSFDRTFGYGLKFESGFKNTHLGKL
jgi:hypothetical protein